MYFDYVWVSSQYVIGSVSEREVFQRSVCLGCIWGADDYYEILVQLCIVTIILFTNFP